MLGKNNYRKKQSRKINRKKSIGKNQQEKISRKNNRIGGGNIFNQKPE